MTFLNNASKVVEEKLQSKFNFTRFGRLEEYNSGTAGGIATFSVEGGKLVAKIDLHELGKMLGEDSEISHAIEAITIHECLHSIFPELDETEAFKRKDAGDISLYIHIEKMTWEKVKAEFPEYSEICDFFSSQL